MQLVSLGIVTLGSHHHLTSETLKPSIAMVNGSVHIVYSMNVL